MGNFNLGSVTEEVSKRIEDVPSTLSGTAMYNLIEQERVFMECYIGLDTGTIGSTAIIDKYQPALIELSAASVLRSMELIGVDTASIKIGDYSENKGGSSNTATAAKFFGDSAQRKLDCLKLANFHFYKANG